MTLATTATAKLSTPTKQRTKHCVKCGEKKELLQFPKNADSSDGLSSYCKQCKSNLASARRIQDAGARFTHYIVSRLKHEFGKDNLPGDIETHLENYLGYKMFQLRKKLREEVTEKHGRTLTSCFLDGWHLDHKRPLSSFAPHKVGDATFKQCWALSNLEMIPALDNLKKGAKTE